MTCESAAGLASAVLWVAAPITAGVSEVVMADNVRVLLNLLASESEDYSEPYYVRRYTRELDPDEILHTRVEATTGGQAVTIGQVGTPSMMVAKNLSSETGETVTLAYTNAAGAVSVSLGLGQLHYTEDVTAADITLTSALGEPLVELYVAGS